MIRKINSEDTKEIRQQVLRPGQPLEACFFNNDLAESTLHLGAFKDEKLIGIVSFMQEDQSFFVGKQYRMRGMAVLPEFQARGYGKQLVLYGEEQMRALEVTMLWFNAREIAVNFYKKLGFKVKGSSFEIPSVGTHYLMYKTLDN